MSSIMKHWALWLVIGGLSIEWIDDFTNAGVSGQGMFYNSKTGIFKGMQPGAAGWSLPEDIGIVLATVGVLFIFFHKDKA